MAFYKSSKVPASLQQRINDYYDHLWENKTGLDEAQLTAELPPSLQQSRPLVRSKLSPLGFIFSSISPFHVLTLSSANLNSAPNGDDDGIFPKWHQNGLGS